MSGCYNVVALVSGGKDSTMSMMRCVAQGHRIQALANLYPAEGEMDELDSFMYQTVGHEGIEAIAECMDLPMFRRPMRSGRSLSTELEYRQTAGDEVEDLFLLLKHIKQSMPEINAVASGAILSNYQRTRVESVCMRLGLVSLAFLWREDQGRLLDEIVDVGIEAILIKVACLGLNPRDHLGKSLQHMRPILHRLNKEFGCHICGEGGEFETFTLDCSLYKHRILIDESEAVLHQDDDVAPVAYLKLTKLRLEAKGASVDAVQVSDSMVQARRRVIHVQPDNDTEPSASCADCVPDLGGVQKEFQKDSHLRGGSSVLKVHPARSAAQVCSDVAWMTIADEASAVLKSLEAELQRNHDEQGTTANPWSDAVLVGVYLKDMSDFASVNEVYKHHVPLRCPAARLCVGLPLGDSRGERIKIEVVSIRGRGTVETLHVQSVSRWAPCNIGPYSQAKVLTKRVVLVSGQIGLEPASMCLASVGDQAPSVDEEAMQAAAEAAQCLHNLEAILEVCGSTLLASFRVTAFVTSPCAAREAVLAWCRFRGEKGARSGLEGEGINLVQVVSLPRGAQVEYQVAALRVPEGSPGQAGVHTLQVNPEGVQVSCWGVHGAACGAACWTAAGGEGQPDAAGDGHSCACAEQWRQCGRRLAAAVVACLGACSLSPEQVVSLRLFYSLGQACSNEACCQQHQEQVQEALDQGMASGMRQLMGDHERLPALSVLPALGLRVGQPLESERNVDSEPLPAHQAVSSHNFMVGCALLELIAANLDCIASLD